MITDSQITAYRLIPAGPGQVADSCNAYGCREPAGVQVDVAITRLRFCRPHALEVHRKLGTALQPYVATCFGCRRSFTASDFRKLATPRKGGRQDSGINGYLVALGNCACGSTIGAAMTVDGVLISEQDWAAIEERIEAGETEAGQRAAEADAKADLAAPVKL